MRKRRFTAIVCAVLLFSMVLLPGCRKETQPETSLPPESSVSETESEPSASSQEEISSSQEPSLPESSENEVVNTITTDNAQFDKLFAANPLDTAYKEESSDDYSVVDMEQTASKFAELWQTEVDSAYKKLLEVSAASEKEQFKSEQETWVADTPAALQKITDDAQAAGGSLARVIAAGETMEYYRLRAAQLYRALYDYDPSFAFAYSQEESSPKG